MTTLAEQQQRFKHLVLADSVLPNAVSELFAPAANGAEPRVAIYRNAYRGRLIAALAANYPVLQRVLGDDAFAALASRYIDRCPSRHPSIRWFGHGLPDYLLDQHDELPHPALRDLAALEWALCAAFDAADAPAATADDFAKLSPEEWPGAILRTHPSTGVLTLDWAVEPVWQAMTQSADRGVEDQVAEPEASSHSVVVWRHRLSPCWRTLDTLEMSCLQALADGISFANLCELIATQLSDADAAAQTAAGLLQRWLQDELLVAA